MYLECPQCHSMNSESATRCACGFELTSVAQPEDSIDFAQSERDRQGIGGWLILFGTWLVIQPVVMLYEILTSRFQLVIDVLIAVLLSAIIIFNLFVAMRFLQQRRQAPKLVIALLMLTLIFAITSMVAVSLAEPGVSQEVASIGRAAIWNLIWIMYFIRSKRVKKTFIY